MSSLILSYVVIALAVLQPSALAARSAKWDLLSCDQWQLQGNLAASGLANGTASVPATIPGYVYDAVEASGLVQNPTLA
jgi:hypothetical protein